MIDFNMSNLNFFPSVNTTTSSAFGWLSDAAGKVTDSINKNPEVWKLGASIVGGAAQGYLSAQQAKELKEMEMLKMEQQERFNSRKASSGKGYDTHSSNLVGGTGLLAPEMGRM